jgi:hypothetical protein
MALQQSVGEIEKRPPAPSVRRGVDQPVRKKA